MENIIYAVIAAFLLMCLITYLYRNRKTRRFIKDLLRFTQGCHDFTHEDLGMKIWVLERNRRSVKVTNLTITEISFNGRSEPISPELYRIPRENRKDELQKGQWYKVVRAEKKNAVKLVPTEV